MACLAVLYMINSHFSNVSRNEAILANSVAKSILCQGGAAGRDMS